MTASVHMQVSNRIHRLAVQIKDEVAAGATGDQGEADAEQTRTKSKKKLTVGKVKSGERGREETATKGTAPERDKGAGTFAPATGRNKSVWSKQLEDLAVKAAVAKAEASKSVAVEPAQAAEGVGGVAGSRAGRKQSVRRSTKPPPSRRLPRSRWHATTPRPCWSSGPERRHGRTSLRSKQPSIWRRFAFGIVTARGPGSWWATSRRACRLH